MGPLPRRSTPLRGVVSVAAVALLGCGVAACGSTRHFADLHRPPLPANLTVYVDDNHVSVSPARIGGGPVTLLVTNEASGTEDVTLARSGGSGASSGSGDSGGSGVTANRSSGDINSGATADIQASVTQGTYEIRAGKKILPARLTITHERPNADNALLQP